MNDRIKNTFGQICAEEELKDKTREFLVKKTRGYSKNRFVNYKYLVSAAACMFFVLMGGYWIYFIPTAVIRIDINPSIELDINRFDRVVSVHARNDDGQELADALSIKFSDYEEAVSEVLENEKITALLSEDEIMTIAVVGPEGEQCKRMCSQIESCTSGNRNAYCYFMRSEEAGKAHEMGLSYGKYRAFLELQELDPDIKPEEIQGMTMREIRDWIQRLSPDEQETQTEDKTGYGHHGAGNGYRRGNRRNAD